LGGESGKADILAADKAKKDISSAGSQPFVFVSGGEGHGSEQSSGGPDTASIVKTILQADQAVSKPGLSVIVFMYLQRDETVNFQVADKTGGHPQAKKSIFGIHCQGVLGRLPEQTQTDVGWVQNIGRQYIGRTGPSPEGGVR
jgi:hypothetical protein